MDKHTKFWLVVEVAVTFMPLVLGWIILLMMVPIQVAALAELDWQGPVLVFYFLVAGPVGMTGMYAMLVYLLRDGQRILSKRAMLVCVGLGIVTLALAVIPPWEITSLGVLYLLPLLSALHVLYLGRSYFSANKPFQPMREDARSG
ncbi:MAG: hypothetical protein ABW034_20065 [Steroidobacteraceae bacterium]